VRFISENTIPLIIFDLSLKDQVLKASNLHAYAIIKDLRNCKRHFMASFLMYFDLFLQVKL